MCDMMTLAEQVTFVYEKMYKVLGTRNRRVPDSISYILLHEERRTQHAIDSTLGAILEEDPEMLCFGEESNVEDMWTEYVRKTLQHKLDVFTLGVRILNFGHTVGVLPLEEDMWVARLASHDLSKFSLHEASYAAVDFSNPQFHQTPAFRQAWEHHLIVNDHHPKFWIVNGIPTTMFRMAITEMIVDWIAMSKAHGTGWESVDAQVGKHKFSEETRDKVLEYIERIKLSQVFADTLGAVDPMSLKKKTSGIW